MAEIWLPRDNRTAEFFATFTIKEEGDYILAYDEYIQAPGRGDEIMDIIHQELQTVASMRGKRVIFRCSASTVEGKRLIQRQNGYNWIGRSSDGYSMYEKLFIP